jgi:RNA polymerase sigma-70 factor (ECF subfamily)
MVRSDEELLSRIQAREADALEALMARYEGALQAHIRRMVQDRSAAEDLVQELFLRVWTRADQWQEQGAVKGWLFRIAANLSLNYLRTVRRRREQPLEIPTQPDDEEDMPAPAWMVDAGAVSPQERTERIEEHRLLHRLIEELPEDKRDVFRLVHESELGIRGAAEILGIPEGTVKSRLYYTMKHLVRAWHELNSDWEDLP